MTRTATLSSSGAAVPTRSPSPTRTAVEDPIGSGGGVKAAEHKWVQAEESPNDRIAQEAEKQEGPNGAEIKLSQKRKWFLLFIFSVAQVRIHGYPRVRGSGLTEPTLVPRRGQLFRVVRLHRRHPYRPRYPVSIVVVDHREHTFAGCCAVTDDVVLVLARPLTR